MIAKIILTVALCLTSVAPSFAAAPLAVGSVKQLFIDRRFIESAQGVQVVVNRPRPTGEKLIVAEKPWEDMAVISYISVIQEGERIHLWYEAADHRGSDDAHGNAVALAFSTDGGATWTRPNLGVVKYQGSTDNNLVLTGVHGTVVFRNRPDAPAGERFCLFSGVKPHKQGALYVSPDGIHWAPKGKTPFFNMGIYDGLDSQNVMFWDTRIKKYVAFPRLWVGMVRKVGYSENEVLGDFPAPKVVFGPDTQDPPQMDFYTSSAIEYPYAADAYFMFPAAYHQTPPPPLNDGLLDIQFAASRDGVTWLRPDRSPIIPLGFDGQWNCAQLYTGCGLSRHGDELSLYYGAYTVPHGVVEVNKYLGVITRAIYRLDGFMSVDAGYDGGQFTTPPLVFAGDSLELNFDGSAGGSARVELLDAAGKPIAGFTEKEADKIIGNAVAKKVTWAGKGELTPLKGTPVKLRFLMRDCKLYAFQFPATQAK